MCQAQLIDEIGKFPLIIRPAFTLGGTGGGIAYNMDEYHEIVHAGLAASLTNQARGLSHGFTGIRVYQALPASPGIQPLTKQHWSPITPCLPLNSRAGRCHSQCISVFVTAGGGKRNLWRARTE